MSTTDSTSAATTVTNSPASTSIIPITSHHHLPIKLTTTNYPPWRAHFLALLNGYSLTTYITAAPTENSSLTEVQRFQQDQLLLAAILGSVSSDILPLISLAQTSAEAWAILSRAFASTSRQRVMQLKTDLARATIGSRSVAEFINYIKAKTDELGLIDEPVKPDDLTLYVINGLGSAYRDIVGAIRTRETPLRFEELRDHLVEHENLLRNTEQEHAQLVATANVAQSSGASSMRPHQNRNSNGGRVQSNQGRGQHYGRNNGYGNSNRGKGRNNGTGYYNNIHGQYNGYGQNNPRPQIFCQMCAYPGHTAPYCRRFNATANVAHSPQRHSPQSSWLVDSGASHNLTNELSNLSIHSEYDGTDEIQIADGSGLPISHTGSPNGSTPGPRTM